MSNICLVSCAKTKLTHNAPAQELYVSELFNKMRNFASSRFDQWFILSAKYGLLKPNQIIEPYEKTLNNMKRGERREWAFRVATELMKQTSPHDTITFLAGDKYRQDLAQLLIKNGYTIFAPLQGLPIGKQLSWLKQKNAE